MIKYIFAVLLLLAPASGWGWQLICDNTTLFCDLATNEIGDRDATGSTGQTMYNGNAYVFKWTPDCSGPLNTAYMYHSDISTGNIILGVYLDDGDGIPGAGDTLVSQSGGMTSSTIEFKSSAMGSGSVVTSSSYFIAYLPNGTNWQYSYETANYSYYKTVTWGSTFPAALDASGWNSNSRRPVGYISIGN